MPHWIIRSWYTGHWWVGCYIRYSDAQSPPRCTKCNSPPINGQCIPITVLLYDGPLLCGFNVAIKGVNSYDHQLDPQLMTSCDVHVTTMSLPSRLVFDPRRNRHVCVCESTTLSTLSLWTNQSLTSLTLRLGAFQVILCIYARCAPFVECTFWQHPKHVAYGRTTQSKLIQPITRIAVLEAMTRVYGKMENSTPRKYKKWLKIFKRRPEYMITSRSWVVVENPSKIGPPNFDGAIGEVWVFLLTHTHTDNQSNKFFHLGYRSQIWKDLKHLWPKTRGFTPCAFWGYCWWQIMFRGPNPPKTHFGDHSMQNIL